MATTLQTQSMVFTVDILHENLHTSLESFCVMSHDYSNLPDVQAKDALHNISKNIPLQ